MRSAQPFNVLLQRCALLDERCFLLPKLLKLFHVLPLALGEFGIFMGDLCLRLAELVALLLEVVGQFPGLLKIHVHVLFLLSKTCNRSV